MPPGVDVDLIHIRKHNDAVALIYFPNVQICGHVQILLGGRDATRDCPDTLRRFYQDQMFEYYFRYISVSKDGFVMHVLLHSTLELLYKMNLLYIIVIMLLTTNTILY